MIKASGDAITLDSAAKMAPNTPMQPLMMSAFLLPNLSANSRVRNEPKMAPKDTALEVREYRRVTVASEMGSSLVDALRNTKSIISRSDLINRLGFIDLSEMGSSNAGSLLNRESIAEKSIISLSDLINRLGFIDWSDPLNVTSMTDFCEYRLVNEDLIQF